MKPKDRSWSMRRAWATTSASAVRCRLRAWKERPGNSLAVAEYSLWRRVSETGASTAAAKPLMQAGEVWDFIASIPAVKFSEYGFVALTLADSSVRWGLHWTAFMVSAMIPGQSPFHSTPDSGYSVDNTSPGIPPLWRVTSGDGAIDLYWSAPQDADLMDYVVERSESPSNPAKRKVLGVVTSTSFHDPSPPALRVYYRVFARDSSGNPSVGAPWMEGVVSSAGDNGDVPEAYALYQNFPNPFNPATIIRYALPGTGHVRLDVYNALGQRVGELVSEEQYAGYYDVRFDASRLPSGVYFVRLAAGSFTAVTKMYLLK